MAVLIVVLVIAACVAGVIRNRRNAEAALAGVSFTVSAPPRQVFLAISEAFCGGAKAGLRSMVTGVSVAPAGDTSFAYKTKHGDVGTIAVGANGSGSSVTASASELFVGNTEVFKTQRSKLHASGVGLTHGILLLLHVTPNAAKMKRFASGLEPKLAKRLGIVSAPALPTVPIGGAPGVLIDDDAPV
jgi:hypothetical protein